MREALIDVTLEVEVTNDLDAISDPQFHRQAMERMRDKAEVAAREAGGRLRTDRMPELMVPQKVSPTSPLLQHQDYVLFASRWHVEVPEHFHGDGR
jgi:hypothetical protein